jgi:hypothetical protein
MSVEALTLERDEQIAAARLTRVGAEPPNAAPQRTRSLAGHRARAGHLQHLFDGKERHPSVIRDQ